MSTSGTRRAAAANSSSGIGGDDAGGGEQQRVQRAVAGERGRRRVTLEPEQHAHRDRGEHGGLGGEAVQRVEAGADRFFIRPYSANENARLERDPRRPARSRRVR